LDLVFSFDSVITAAGIADHIEVLIAAVVVAIGVLMVAAAPAAAFVSKHPSPEMLALAFLARVGVALLADGLLFGIGPGCGYAAMAFAGCVAGLSLDRGRKVRTARAGK